AGPLGSRRPTLLLSGTSSGGDHGRPREGPPYRLSSGIGGLGVRVGGGRYPAWTMREARAIRGLPLFGIAASGMIAGHWLSYRISVPSAAARQLLLAATGQANWLLVAKLAASVGLAGVGALFARHLSDRHPARSPSGFEGYAFVLVRLA